MTTLITAAKETRGAYHLAKKSGNFGLKTNGKVLLFSHSERNDGNFLTIW